MTADRSNGPRNQALPGAARHARRSTASRLAIVDIGASAFPYDGIVPDTGAPFLQSDGDKQPFHDAPRGGRLLASKTYADTRSLLFVPSRFDPHKPAALVVFFHGNLATLTRDVADRQRVPEQVEASQANVLLVAPQLAVDALDSSAGHFWEASFFETYLHKAAVRLAALSAGRVDAAAIDRLPVIVVAYSGGYLATAFSLSHAMADGRSRIVGVVLLDALFGEEPKFERWVAATHARSVFVSAYSRSSADLNARLERALASDGTPVLQALPSRLQPGDVVFQPALGAAHDAFVTQAFATDPLRVVLERIDLARIGGAPAKGDRGDAAPADRIAR